MKAVLEHMPEGLEEFQALPCCAPDRPENTCMLFFCALHLFLSDVQAGTAALNRLRGTGPLTAGEQQQLCSRLKGREYLTRAYFDGATPENGYRPEEPYTLELTPDLHPTEPEKDSKRFFLTTAGADAPRPVRLCRRDGQWLLQEYASLLTAVRPPQAEE